VTTAFAPVLEREQRHADETIIVEHVELLVQSDVTRFLFVHLAFFF
jgi:hypothetical protein